MQYVRQPDSSLPAQGADELALWRQMKEGGSQIARDRLFAQHLPFARSIAARHYKNRNGQDVEFGDLYQLACAGLLEAMNRYDPSTGVAFRSYAARRIIGSIRDGIGKLSEFREQIRFRKRVQMDRARSLRPASPEKLSKNEAMEALAAMAAGLAIGFMLEDTSLFLGENQRDVRPSAYESMRWKEVVRHLLAEVDRLPHREQQIIRLHYLEDVSFSEIAALFGLTKGRIAQLHQQSLSLLGKRLKGTGGFSLEE